jgi:ElaB/YqjD/DUF883 family membrane-anchored ribosome-binding protein
MKGSFTPPFGRLFPAEGRQGRRRGIMRVLEGESMAEIKSTLELALERTKKMAISEKEKEEIRQKKFLEKAKGLFHRYREGHAPLSELQKEIERMDEKTSASVKEFLLSQWIDALSLTEEDERLIKGIEWLKNGRLEELPERFRHLLSQHREEMEKTRQEVRTRLEEALKREGIAGSAVEPNVEGNLLWKETVEKLDHLYAGKLEEIRKHLRNL